MITTERSSSEELPPGPEEYGTEMSPQLRIPTPSSPTEFHNPRRPNEYIAHTKLMKSLAVEPKYPTNIDKPKMAETASYLKEADLSQYVPKPDPLKAKRDDKALVRALADPQLQIATPEDNFEKLRKLSEKRSKAHDAVIKQYNETFYTICDEVEKQVLEASRDVRDQMEKIDKEIAQIFVYLNDDQYIIKKDIFEVQDMWKDIETKCTNRKEIITEYCDELDKIEEDRGGKMKDIYDKVINDLTDIGYMLVPEIHELVEELSHEANLVILSNMKDFADIRSRLLKEDLSLFITSKQNYERREVEYRKLKHEELIKSYLDSIGIDVIVNSDERKQLIKEMREGQEKIHNEHRLPLLEKINQQHINEVDDEFINYIINTSEDVANMENEMNEEYFYKLQGLNDTMNKMIMDKRQELRFNLHHYEALEKNGLLKECHNKILELISAQELDEFFLKAGSLKKELMYICDESGKEYMIEEDDRKQLSERLVLPLECLTINKIYEESGLMMDKEQCLTTLNKIKAGTRLEVVGLVPLIIKQLETLTQLEIYPEIVLVQLNDIKEQFQQVQEDITLNENESQATGMRSMALSLNSRLTAGSQGRRTSLMKSGSRTSITGGKKTAGGGGTRRTSIMSGDPRLAKATSRKSTLSALSRQSKLSKMSAASDAAKKLDIHLIKSLCNRLGMILCVSDLPVDIKQELMNLQKELFQQQKSNEVIDNEISQKTDEAIQEVRKQMNDFIEAVGVNLQDHSFMLSEEVSKIVQFYTKIRDILKEHKNKNEYIDLLCEDTLTTSLEKYEDNDKELENKLAALVKLLRESPNLEECDTRFANCLEMLNNIEQFYRDYQIEVVGISRQHPIDGKNECENYRMNVCNLYDVYPKDKELPQIEVPKPPEDEESEGKNSGRKRNSKIVKKKSPRSNNGKNGNVVEEEEEKPETIMQPIPIYGEFEVETSESYYYIKEEDEFLKYNFKHGYKEAIEKQKRQEERKKEEERLKAEEEARLLEEAKHKKKPQQAKSIKKGKQPEPEPEPEPQAVIEEEEEEEKKDIPIQIDTDGMPCVLQLEIPYDGLKSMIEVSRNNLLDFYHNELEERMAKLEALCKKRVKTFTKELEDRLRHHWPRRGRIETENKIPREAEILSHHQKYQRFIRLLVDKNSNHENHYLSLMKEYRKELDTYKEYMKQLEDALGKQTSLSGLEGIHTRARQVKEKLMKKSKECHIGLLNYTKIEPDRLRESCDQYIKESILFKNGGDYDDEEVADDRKGFDEWLEGLTETVKEREENINTLTENEKRELEKFPEFDKLVEKYVLEISLRDGVGVKYGAPRRRLSEKLRSEITRSNKLKEEIETRMDGIKQLLSMEPGMAMIPSLSEELLKKLYELRTKIYYYSLYMDVLKNDNVVEMTKLCLKDLDPKNEETGEIDEEQLVDPKFTPPEYKFMPRVMEAIEQCKEETTELYASVGRQDLLTGNGLPESLLNFVQNIQDKGQTYRDNTSIEFREDLDKLLLLLNQVSYVVFNDLVKRIKENCNDETKNVKKNYDEFMKDSESKRNKHELALKPDLGSKNCIDKLEALMKEEEERQNEEIKYIKKSRKTVIKAVHNQSTYFKNSFFHLFTTMLSIMDNLIYRCDFKPLPGDEKIIPPKNGMKILMQLEKQKEEGKYVEPIRMREKLWNGVDLSKLMTVPENIEDALADNDDEEGEGAGETKDDRSESRKSRKSTTMKKGKSTPASPVKKSKPASPKKKSTTKGGKDSSSGGSGLHIDIPESEEGFSDNVGSFGASCQRECAKLRNELYEKFCEEYNKDINSSDEFYKNELHRVDIWKNNWTKLIDLLKKTHEEK